MSTRKIDKPEWRAYFDRFTSKHLKDTVPEFTRIEVLSADMGAQLECGKERLLGLTYDPKDDAFEAEFSDFTHRILHPREIHVIEDAKGFITGIQVLVEKVDLGMRKGREEVLTLSHTLGTRGLLQAPARHP